MEREEITIGGVLLNEENYTDLRDAYRKAIKADLTEFEFQGETMLVSFAKFVLEEMETHAIIKPLIEDDES